MSVRALTWALDQRTGSPTAKAILMVLADHANEEGECWPSIDRIAHLAETTRRTVQRHLQDLEDKRLVFRSERKRSNGSRGTDMYRLAVAIEIGVPEPAKDAPIKPEGVGRQIDTPNGGGVSDSQNRGDTHDQSGVTPMSPPIEPSLEPSKEVSLSARDDRRVDVENSDPLEQLPSYTLAAIRGLYGGPGREGTDELVWSKVDDQDDRERMLRTTVLRWLGEGHTQFNSRLFRRILETVVQDSRGGGARASPSRHRPTYLDDDDDELQEAS